MTRRRESPRKYKGGRGWVGWSCPTQVLCRQFVVGFPIPFIKKLLLSSYQACSVKAMRIFMEVHREEVCLAGISVTMGAKRLGRGGTDL